MLLIPLTCIDNPRNSEASLDWAIVCNWWLSELFAARMNDSSGDMFAVPLALIWSISFRWLSSCVSALIGSNGGTIRTIRTHAGTRGLLQ